MYCSENEWNYCKEDTPAEVPDEIEAIVEEFFKLFKSEGEKMLVTKADAYEKWLREKLTSLQASTDKKVAEAVKAEREKLGMILEELVSFTSIGTIKEANSHIKEVLENYQALTDNHEA